MHEVRSLPDEVTIIAPPPRARGAGRAASETFHAMSAA
jgi:hypothetical protein